MKENARNESTKLKKEDFKDDLSLKEFGISGICHKYQDGDFK